uniref:Uncharacterized protein n=1 Tax=Anguilla anguilla TaxID=7936 RepID=A0A0E9PCZ3_ANGAN
MLVGWAHTHPESMGTTLLTLIKLQIYTNKYVFQVSAFLIIQETSNKHDLELRFFLHIHI